MDGAYPDRLLLPAGALERRRLTRYRGDDRGVQLEAFGTADAATLASLYALLTSVRRLAREPAATAVASVRKGLDEAGSATILEAIRGIGRGVDDPSLKEIIHDLRGGPLGALAMLLAHFGDGDFDASQLRAAGLLARDHQKVMRSLVTDLDPAGRAADLATVPHSLEDVVAALTGWSAGHDELRVEVIVNCPAGETVADSCVECSAVDRILYNLLNNAARHADPPRVSMTFANVLGDLRVVVSNPVRAADQETLRAQLERSPFSLFDSYTTTGSGRGLRIVAALVASAYGFLDLAELHRGGHIGAELEGEVFSVWFHWPLGGA